VSFGIRFAKHFALSPQEGARTLIYLASSPEGGNVTGQYFHECRVVEPSLAAQNEPLAQRLWQETARLAGLPG
jgi:hypothetical protein